jgi:asparagine synthase (glutamine-hydrolysing)
MCGIFGIALADSQISRELFEQSLDLIHHRGPDSTGINYDDVSNVGLGHKRLSIVDLTELGSQPMSSNNLLYEIIFNGEIYNFKELKQELISLGHSFKSQSDTEVLLNSYVEWGPDSVSRLKGMFSLAIFDKKKKTIFLSRDRAGEKPLFYALYKNNFFFSSEIKPILNYENELNKIDAYSFSYLFEHGFTQGEKSIFEDIHKLTPGDSLEFDLVNRSYEIINYWSITKKIKTKIKKNPSCSEEKLIKKLEAHLESAVQSQLYADVPIAVMLSGGLDSSLITAIASRFKKNLNTFTVTFPGHGRFDESDHARLISENYNTNHHQVEAKEINPEIIEGLAYFFDDPMFDPSMIPTYLVSREISRNFKVALSGDGGDELFGGYNHYSKLRKLRAFSNFVPLPIRKYTNNLVQTFLPIGFRGRKTIELFSTDFNTSFPNTGEFFSIKEQKSYFRNEFFDAPKYTNKNTYTDKFDYSLVAMLHDFKNYLPNDLLVKVDRASMANSIEVRAPFLDKDLIEFAFTEVPSSLKLSHQNKKILLKKLASKILPPTFSVNRKQGFSIPLGNFLSEKNWIEYFAETILDSDSSLINQPKCMELLADRGRIYQNAGRLFGLVFYIKWMKKINTSF